MALPLAALPFTVTDWSKVPAEVHPGEAGTAIWRTIQAEGLRLRMVEYSPGYRADHWCSRGHLLLVLSGAMATELRDGRSFNLTAGMSYQVADGASEHRSATEEGAVLYIVD
ncbi:MAG TPA: DHCW motif cupin fold protein [Holophagaceae bacterium]|nr:DHCW motif cupin fold protein [Holophagaceae bacterium]